MSVQPSWRWIRGEGRGCFDWPWLQPPDFVAPSIPPFDASFDHFLVFFQFCTSPHTLCGSTPCLPVLPAGSEFHSSYIPLAPETSLGRIKKLLFFLPRGTSLPSCQSRPLPSLPSEVWNSLRDIRSHLQVRKWGPREGCDRASRNPRLF